MTDGSLRDDKSPSSRILLENHLLLSFPGLAEMSKYATVENEEKGTGMAAIGWDFLSMSGWQ